MRYDNEQSAARHSRVGESASTTQGEKPNRARACCDNLEYGFQKTGQGYLWSRGTVQGLGEGLGDFFFFSVSWRLLGDVLFLDQGTHSIHVFILPRADCAVHVRIVPLDACMVVEVGTDVQ